MARAPILRKIDHSLFNNVPIEVRKGLHQLVNVLNPFLTDVTEALDQGLTFGDNFKTSTTAVDFVAPTDTSFLAVNYGLGTNQSVLTDVTTIVDFKGKIYDTHNAVTPGANWKFTVPKGMGGYYSLNTVLAISNSNANEHFVQVNKNGAPFVRLERKSGTASGIFSIEGTTDLLLKSGDFIQVIIRHSALKTITLESGTPAYAFVNIRLLNRVDSDPLPSTTSTPFPLVINSGFKPSGIQAVQCEEIRGMNRVSTQIPTIVWRNDNKGRTELLDVRGEGLVPGRKYRLTLQMT